jgi:hypothetical protein
MEDTSKGVPQFATAEFAPSSSLACAACKRPIPGPYFRINGAQACAECTSKIQERVPKDSHAAFVRAIACGVAGGIVGFAIYVIFALATGLVIGWVSVAVGFIVGKAMNWGSRGAGGRRYQVVAVFITYVAVSLSAVPIAIHQMRQHQHPPQVSATTAPQGYGNLGKAIGVLALVGIASPILGMKDPVNGIIGLVILFVGLRFAWRYTAGRTLDVSGPHTPSPAGVI